MNMRRKQEQFAASYLEDFAYKSEMKHTTSMVYDAILYHCKIISQTDVSRVRQTKFVSQDKIALMILKSVRTVSKAIKQLKLIESGFVHTSDGIAKPIPLLQVTQNQYGNATYTVVTDLKKAPKTSCTESKNVLLQQEQILVPVRTHDVLHQQEHMSAYQQKNNKNNKIITKANNNKLINQKIPNHIIDALQDDDDLF
jgi:hypothetical protein